MRCERSFAILRRRRRRRRQLSDYLRHQAFLSGSESGCSLDTPMRFSWRTGVVSNWRKSSASNQGNNEDREEILM